MSDVTHFSSRVDQMPSAHTTKATSRATGIQYPSRISEGSRTLESDQFSPKNRPTVLNPCHKNDLGDILISNPPYTKKKEIFLRLKELNKPFIMLVPTTCLHTQYFKEIFKDETMQLIIPYKKRQFDKVGKEKQKDNCSFYTPWLSPHAQSGGGS